MAVLYRQKVKAGAGSILAEGTDPLEPTTITEDEVNNGGDLISSIVGSSISDVNAGALEGIAVTGLASSNGTWEYSRSQELTSLNDKTVFTNTARL